MKTVQLFVSQTTMEASVDVNVKTLQVIKKSLNDKIFDNGSIER